VSRHGVARLAYTHETRLRLPFVKKKNLPSLDEQAWCSKACVFREVPDGVCFFLLIFVFFFVEILQSQYTMTFFHTVKILGGTKNKFFEGNIR